MRICYDYFENSKTLIDRRFLNTWFSGDSSLLSSRAQIEMSFFLNYYYHEIVHRVHKNNTKIKKFKKSLKKANVLTPIIAHTANNFINVWGSKDTIRYKQNMTFQHQQLKHTHSTTVWWLSSSTHTNLINILSTKLFTQQVIQRQGEIFTSKTYIPSNSWSHPTKKTP